MDLRRDWRDVLERVPLSSLSSSETAAGARASRPVLTRVAANTVSLKQKCARFQMVPSFAPGRGPADAPALRNVSSSASGFRALLWRIPSRLGSTVHTRVIHLTCGQ